MTNRKRRSAAAASNSVDITLHGKIPHSSWKLPSVYTIIYIDPIDDFMY